MPDPGYAESVTDIAALSQPRRTATEAEARALASTVRLRILRACLDAALTNRQIAERVGRNPATVLHHVRTLVDTGFLAPQSARRGARGAREVPYRATGKSWLLDLQPTGERDHLLAAFLEEVAAVGQDRLRSSRLGLRLSADELVEFQNRLQAVLDEYAARPPTPGGQRWSVYLGLHPEDG